MWLADLKRKPQGIWKAVRGSSTSMKSSVPIFGENLSSSDVADKINQVFADAFSAQSIEDFHPPSNQSEWKPVCNQEVVRAQLRGLKVGKAAGNDNLTPRLLKAACDILVAPLTHLFCLSISCCVVPESWKIAHVVPIPKKTCASASDFRPISLLPVVSKILEKIVLSSVKDALISNYGRNQFGFRPGSSTLLAHISIHD